MKDIANWIKVGAVATAAPRWVGALLAAEGFILPVSWLVWWIPASAALSACMAVVEGLAFAYVFEAWRNQQDKDGNKLLWFALFSALVFVGVLSPYIAASVSKTGLSEILVNKGWLLVWSAFVALSTIAIVASVGYAQKKKTERQANPALDTANTTIRELRKELKDTEQARTTAEQKAKAAEQGANAANENLRLSEQTAKEAKIKAQVAEEQLAVAEQKVSELSAAANNVMPLFADDKRERILAARELWPRLSQTAVAIITDTAPSYVSEVLNNTTIEAVDTVTVLASNGNHKGE